MGMKSKKSVELKQFNNFNDSSNGIKVERFYNYLPTSTLKNSFGVNCNQRVFAAQSESMEKFGLQSAGKLGYLRKTDQRKLWSRSFLCASDDLFG